MSKKSKIGLALSGGATLGAAHIGVLKALEEKDISIDYIAGTSIGSWIATLYAFGKTPEEIAEVAIGLEWIDIAGISLSKHGLLSNRKMKKLIFDHIGNAKLEEANIPISIIATDISKGEKVTITKGECATAVMASTCVPGIFNPVEMDGRLLVDGGIVENVPVTALRSMNADFIIAVDLNSNQTFEKPNNIIEVLLNSFGLIMQASIDPHIEHVNVLIEPDLSSFNWIETDQVKDLIQAGYEQAIKALDSADMDIFK